MPDHFPPNILALDGAEPATIEAVFARPDDVEALVADALDALDECAVMLMLKDDDISRFQATQKEGGCGDDYKIPFLIFWQHAVTDNAKDAEHGIKVSVQTSAIRHQLFSKKIVFLIFSAVFINCNARFI